MIVDKNYSWIILNYNPFSYKSFKPVKMLDDDILNLKENVMMCPTRRAALDELIKDMNEASVEGLMKEFKSTSRLKWKDATVCTYALSLFDVVTSPLLVYIFVPIFVPFTKYKTKKFINRSKIENPEWWL